MQRTYALAQSTTDALAILRSRSDVPVLAEDEARRSRPGEPFFVIRGDTFTLYQPWSRRVVTPEGAPGDSLELGPAVVGRLVADGPGSRLEVYVRPYAPTPAQSRPFLLTVSGYLLLVATIVVAAGFHPLSLAIMGGMTAASAGSILFYRHRQRARDIRNLLAIVERVFGPEERAALDEAPHRREDPGPGEG